MQAKNWEILTIVEGCFENSLYLSSQQWEKKFQSHFLLLYSIDGIAKQE